MLGWMLLILSPCHLHVNLRDVQFLDGTFYSRNGVVMQPDLALHASSIRTHPCFCLYLCTRIITCRPGIAESNVQIGISTKKGVGGTCQARSAGQKLARQGVLSALLEPLLPEASRPEELITPVQQPPFRACSKGSSQSAILTQTLAPDSSPAHDPTASSKCKATTGCFTAAKHCAALSGSPPAVKGTLLPFLALI